MKTRIEVAVALATRAHAGQVDKVGAAYIDHPLRVMEAVRSRGESYAVVGVLHDVVEDGQFSLDEVISICGLREAEAGALALLTREGAGDAERTTYRAYIERIARSEGDAGRLARAVKLADLADNLGRLTADLESLRKRYLRARAILAAFS